LEGEYDAAGKKFERDQDECDIGGMEGERRRLSESSARDRCRDDRREEGRR
jgi:hypothetical protein